MLRYVSCLCLILLTACKNTRVENNDDDLMNRSDKRSQAIGKLFGDDTFSMGQDSKTKMNDESIIGVNVYLWRAALEAIAFLPLNSVDPFGGVILTDWHVFPATPDERIKINVRILDRQLKVTALKISIFRQKNVDGVWTDQVVNPATTLKLEDSILIRAREMKVEAGS